MSRKLKLDISDPATRATWDAAQAARQEVESWPAWKRGEAPRTPVIGHVTPLSGEAPSHRRLGEVPVTVRLDAKRLERADASRATAADAEPDPEAVRAALSEEVTRLWNVEAERDGLMAYVDDAKRALGEDRVAGEPLAQAITDLRAELDAARARIAALEQQLAEALRERDARPSMSVAHEETIAGAQTRAWMWRVLAEWERAGRRTPPQDVRAESERELVSSADGLPEPEPAPAYEDDWERDDRISGTTQELEQLRADLANARKALEIAQHSIDAQRERANAIESRVTEFGQALGIPTAGEPLDVLIRAAHEVIALQRRVAGLEEERDGLTLRLGKQVRAGVKRKAAGKRKGGR